MKRLLWAVPAALFCAVLAGFAYIESTANFDHPQTPFPALKASADPAIIARGEYIVHAVAHCSTCHQSGAHLTKEQGVSVDFAAPLSGGFVFDLGPFGTFRASNITPDSKTGIGRYTDEQVARVIRTGVLPDGRIGAMMRFGVGPMSDDDVVAVLSYLRAQKPVENVVGDEEMGLLAKMISNQIVPRDIPAPAPVSGDEVSVARGEYLAAGPAMCFGCHSPLDPMQGFALAGPAYSGAEAEPDPTDAAYVIAPPNITSAGYLAELSEDGFVLRLKAGRAEVMKGSKMPWEAFQRLTENDMRSLYRYLKTVPPAQTEALPSRRKG